VEEEQCATAMGICVAPLLWAVRQPCFSPIPAPEVYRNQGCVAKAEEIANLNLPCFAQSCVLP